MAPSLKTLIPEPDDLLDLPIEELAGMLLIHLNSEDGAAEYANFGGYISQAQFLTVLSSAAPFGFQEYGDRQPEVNEALNGAWAWLQTYGFLVNDPTKPPELFSISRRGRQVKSLKDFHLYRTGSNTAAQKARSMTTTKIETITNLIGQARNFRFCGPSDDPDEQSAVTLSYRYIVIQLKRLAGPFLPKPLASRLEAIDVDVNDLYSAFEARAELDALLPDIEATLDLMGDAALPTKSLKQVLQDRDLAGVDKEFDRALVNVEKDPPAAITAACSILEAVFKVYLEDNGIEMPADQSLKPLWKTASKHLGLDPSAVEDDDIRKILSGLNSVVDGIGSLRTHTGSAHGRGRRPYRLQARHARLAIHASHTLVGFFIETWDTRNQKAASLLCS